MDRAKNTPRDSNRVRKEQLEAMRVEAARFKLSAIYNESKKILRLLERIPEQHETESHHLRCEFPSATISQHTMTAKFKMKGKGHLSLLNHHVQIYLYCAVNAASEVCNMSGGN
uniref:BHLH domain-containing protein n=1 Tax=Echinococcus granulosus TaxID=6210 RepID=A0A068WZ91_ECHGR|nr:hypothetical protein EgrG_000013100 [Echinococcus granulosus]